MKRYVCKECKKRYGKKVADHHQGKCSCCGGGLKEIEVPDHWGLEPEGKKLKLF